MCICGGACICITAGWCIWAIGGECACTGLGTATLEGGIGLACCKTGGAPGGDGGVGGGEPIKFKGGG